MKTVIYGKVGAKRRISGSAAILNAPGCGKGYSQKLLQATGAKDKPNQQLDRLDVMD